MKNILTSLCIVLCTFSTFSVQAYTDVDIFAANFLAERDIINDNRNHIT